MASKANGMEALFAAAEEAKSAKSGTGGNFKYFQLKDGQTQLIRFISNDVIPVTIFNIKSAEGKFLEPVDTEMTYLENPRPCIIRDYPNIFFGTSQKGEKYPMKPTLAGLGLLVKREEYFENVNGKRVRKVRDLEEEFKDSNGVITKKVIIYLAKMTQSTFWDNLKSVYLRNDKSITTRDLEVTRTGNGPQTKYSFYPMELEDWSQPGEAEAHYTELFGEDALPDRDAWVEYRASEAYYKKNIYPLIPELADQADNGSESNSEATDEAPTESPREGKVSLAESLRQAKAERAKASA